MRPTRLFLLLAFISGSQLATASTADLDSLYARAIRLSINNIDSTALLASRLLTQSLEEGNFEFAGKAAYLIGYVHDEENRISVARVRYVESLKYLRKAVARDEELEAKVLISLGRIHSLTDRTLDAIGVYEEALILCGNCSLESMIHYNIGYGWYAVKSYEKALQQFFKAYQLSLKQENYLRATKSLNYIGLCNHYLGRYDTARAYYKRILDSRNLPEEKYLRSAGHALHNIGFSYFDEGLHHKALDYYLQALETKRQLADSGQQFLTLMDLGELMMVKADTQQAIQYLEQAAALFHLKIPNIESFKVFELLDRATYGRDPEKNRQHMQRLIEEWSAQVTQLAAETERQQSQVLEGFTRHHENKTARLRVYWVASLIAAAIIGLLGFYFYKRRQKRKHREILKLISEV